MPSEQSQSQSASQPRPNHQRSSNSTLVQGRTASPSSTPPQHTKPKTQKHVVGAGRLHTRVPSSKSLHKPTKAHANEGSHTDLKKLGKNASTTSLKNSSAASLKRNRSNPDVTKSQKISQPQEKRPASVHFEIGDQEDVWEEASSSASPALSRSASRSASRSIVSSNHSSAKPSANNSQPQSPLESPTRVSIVNGTSDRQGTRHTADAKVITERLLQRVPSHNTTKMSLATAAASGHSPDYLANSEGSTLNGTPKDNSGKEVVSRFVSGSGTPGENSPFLHNRKPLENEPLRGVEEVKRAKSMGNLSRHNSEDAEDEEESALAPRARKSTTTTHNQSRTQQKLWLQRASSNIEPQQMTPGAAINGGLHGGPLGVSPLVGAGDGRDPRIKLQLERTGLEYLVVRRHQDPIGAALKRLNQLPGADKNRRIPSQSKRADTGTAGAGPGRYGLSQSLKERGSKIKVKNAGPRSSFEEERAGQDDEGRDGEDEGVGALLRSIWDKNYDLSASTD